MAQNVSRHCRYARKAQNEIEHRDVLGYGCKYNGIADENREINERLAK